MIDHWSELAWAAGLFEGEGSILLHVLRKKGKPEYQYPRAQLVTTDLDVLQHFHEVVGVGKIRECRLRPNRKQAWKWSTDSAADAETVLWLLAPWLGARRRERMDFVLGSIRGRVA